jgi:hypothetical protein
MAKKPIALTTTVLCREAKNFAKRESKHLEPALYGVTDGKAVGTYFEQKFIVYLRTKYSFGKGSAALGVDFPELRVDIKVTSIRQPQSSCPFTSARQKSMAWVIPCSYLFMKKRTTIDGKSAG